MNLVTDERICDALVHVLDIHQRRQQQRPLRPLLDADFEKIRAIKKHIQGQWSVYKSVKNHISRPPLNYHEFRAIILDRTACKERWHQTTRNLYASILSVLVNWEQKGVSKDNLKRLDELRPGAQLFLQFLKHNQLKII